MRALQVPTAGMLGQAIGQAAVPAQIVDALRRAVGLQVSRCGADHLLNFAQASGHQRGVRQVAANSKRHIKALADDVQQTVVEGELDLELWVALHERHQDRRQHLEAKRQR
ncbi:hypothetical protein D3C72_2164520 [compost metagenome]